MIGITKDSSVGGISIKDYDIIMKEISFCIDCGMLDLPNDLCSNHHKLFNRFCKTASQQDSETSTEIPRSDYYRIMNKCMRILKKIREPKK